MADPPRRHKQPEEMTPADWDQYRRTRQMPETDEYRQARREHLRAGGFEADDDPEDKPLEEMTPEDHYQRIRSNR